MAEPGDNVRVICKDEELTGILMPRPELLEEDVTVLKLENGYNIGIDNDRIEKIKVLKIYEKTAAKKKAIKQKKGLPAVTIISLGGTISSKIDYKTGGVYADYTAEDFIEMCPELADIANLKAVKAMSLMSEDINPEDWQEIAKAIHRELDKCDGVVVTQGTDTLHFTTAAMSFMLKKLDKPVVFTAAQRSIDRGSSDAFMNLICAVTAAAKMDIAEVCSCMHGTTDDDHCIITRGTKVRKMHTSRRDAFRPVNELPLAKVYADGRITIMNDKFRKRSGSKAKRQLDNVFEKKTALLMIYPGMDPGVMDYYIEKGFRGMVLSATALGHVPTHAKRYSLEPYLKKAKKAGMTIVIASQTLYGRTHRYVYSNLRKLSIGLGCIYAEDMIPETAYIKLGWVLGKTGKPEEIRELMLKDIAGEINDRHMPDSFLY